MPGLGGGRLEHSQLGPRRLGVDVVGRDRRDATPIVDARVEQSWEVSVGEVRRCLQRDAVGQNQPCNGERPEVIIERRLGGVDHLRIGLGAEILDDHLLQVAVFGVQVAQCEQRFDALGARLANANQDAARRRDFQSTHPGESVEADRRLLVGRAIVRHALLAQACARSLEHDPLRRGEGTKRCELLVVEDARVGVGQEPGLGEDALHAVCEVRCSRGEAELGELDARGLVAQLRLVAEREQCLAAARSLALLGDGDHFVGCHIRALTLAGRLGEGAVVADVAAQHRQRDEDLRRVRDDDAVRCVSSCARTGTEPGQIWRRILSERECLGVGQHAVTVARWINFALGSDPKTKLISTGWVKA